MSEIQAVLFDRELWIPRIARIWLKHHELIPIKRVHITDDKLRYRIHEPDYDSFITKKLADGIELIIGFRK